MSVLSEENQQLLEKYLVEEGVISQVKLESVKEKANANSAPILATLVDEAQVSNEVLTKLMAKINHVPYVNLQDARIDKQVLRLLSKEVSQRYMAVPLGQIQNKLVVAMLDADNVQAVDFLSSRIGRPLKVYTASEEGIIKVIKQYDEDIEADVTSTVGSISSAATEEAQQIKEAANAPTNSNIKTIIQDSPISKALSAILEYAARTRASDIHIEPLEHELKIRCRVDGVLREIMKLPKSTEPPLISRIKILSNLKIDEHRIPQDGQFTVDVEGNLIDLRIAISPVIWGEQVVIRLLDKSGTSLKLEDMGYTGRALRTIKKGVAQSNGMILTSGPTGSGKSTSMYALIQEIKNDTINIVTLEDPVEYKIDGINQIQVNAEVGLTFASGLRSILRQDPDVVMVGEIRDKETAALAVQAALTGHLVFSTLHTNSAAGILPRLLDMGIEPFLIASTVRTVIGQRLVRRIADKDKEAYTSSGAEKQAILQNVGNLLPPDEKSKLAYCKDLGYEDLPLRTQNAYTLYKGKDSPDTPGGYKGRMGLYEVFEVSDAIQKLIINHSTSAVIQTQAIKEGMVTMRQDGYLKALAGQTTISEINRVAAEDNA
ncbi:type II secretion system protein E [Candidatus Saccharibacteria bacterium RIFCSPHIGHO2_12_FULL_41_12]|nr:MAG: type II secretion system protein E [Candidatus Saccharibacteria bacterium RIFCSPHIGHO2_12_FULL_41_12]